MKLKNILLLLCILFHTVSKAQNNWVKIEAIDDKNKAVHYKIQKNTKEEQLYALDLASFKTQLNNISATQEGILYLPNTIGGVSKFTLKETTIFERGLAKKYRNIKSYTAKSIETPTTSAKISIGTDGVHIMLFSADKGVMYIDPYTKDCKTYVSYKREALVKGANDFECKVENKDTEYFKANDTTIKNSNQGELRVFRLALACSGEYAQFHLDNQEIDTFATEAVKKEAVLSAMNTSITRINAVFERDVAVKMILVENNDAIIFLDSETDGITDGNATRMLRENQTICDTYIGDENYDIGHLFSTQGDGIAILESICITGLKGSGVTGRTEPIGDAFDIDYVAHEMGHQFGATHTQSSSCNRTNATAVEPGSGSTILGYAGICDSDSNDAIEIDIQENSDAYFHTVSITQMNAVIKNSAICAEIIETNNTAPLVNASFDVTIPASTPFVLKGIAIDTDSEEALTYNWEQTDNEIAIMPPLSTNIKGPLFRSFPSKTTSERYFPSFENVINGNLNIWEVLPSISRELNFALTVRDNNLDGGATGRDDVKITVIEAEPFVVKDIENNVQWTAGSIENITWDVSTTNIAPINCKYVKVKLSTDGGVTFPITLIESTPNDGVYELIVPNYPTTNARILVEAIDNVFYNVNNTNFTINSNNSGFKVNTITNELSICNTSKDTVTYELSIDFLEDFNETVSFNAINLPEGASVSFIPNNISNDGIVLVTINDLDKVIAENYAITLVSKSRSVTQNNIVNLVVYDNSFSEVTIRQPENNSVNNNLIPTLFWESISNASSYDIQVALNVAFSSVVLETNSLINSYVFSSKLIENTTYYWRIKPKNDCKQGVYSSANNFTTSHPSYCTSTFTQETTGAEHITNVTFNTINNDSDNDVVDGYQDFTNLNTTVQIGVTYPLSISYDTAGFQDHCFVFIDWNQDFEFDTTTERFDLGSGSESITTAKFDIEVPEDALLGNTRMRVVIEYDDSNNNYGESACDTTHKTEWGETEDYRIIVASDLISNNSEETILKQFNLYPNPSNGNVYLTFETQKGDNISVNLFDLTGKLIKKRNFVNTSSFFFKELSFDTIPKGLYVLKIQNGENEINQKLILK